MAAGNPATSGMARSLIDSLVGSGKAGGPVPQQSGMQPPDQLGNVLSGKLSEMRQADPQAITRVLQSMKRQIVDLIPQVAFTIPGMNKHLPNLLKTVEAALKEVEQAANVQNTVERNPIQASMAQPPTEPQAGGGMQLPGGGAPMAMPGM